MKKNTVKKKTCKHLWYPIRTEIRSVFKGIENNGAGGGGVWCVGLPKEEEKIVVFCQKCLKKEAI